MVTHNGGLLVLMFLCCRYRGCVPTMKFDYGETYGNQTAKYFQDFRSKSLQTSKSNYCKGGMFPTYYTYNPDYALDARSRTWDRWVQAPRYRLTDIDNDSKEQLINFDKVCKSVYCECTPVWHIVHCVGTGKLEDLGKAYLKN